MKSRRPTKVTSRGDSPSIGKAKAANGKARNGIGAQALLMLGMHRSGTSALTRVFSLLGADLPKNILGPHPTNEAGHWESLDLITIHDDLLATAGSQWDDWRAFNPDWIKSGIAEGYKQKLLGVLQNDFAGSPLFVVKDPRICRFVPLWLEVIERFGAEPYIVIPVRNPLEVAASLKGRDNIPPAKSYLLWLRHVLDAEQATRKLPRVVVTYNDLLNDWRSVVGAVAAKTGLHWPRRSDRSELEIDRFIADRLRHHVVDDGHLTARVDIVDWVKEAYHLLQQIANKRETKDQLIRLDLIHTEFDKACASFGLVLAAEAEQSASQLGSIEARNNAETTVLSQALETLRSAVREHEASATTLRAELDHAQSVSNDRKNEIDKLDAALRSEQSAVRDRDREIERLSHDIGATRLFLRDSQSEIQRLAGELDGAQAETERANAERKRVSEAFALEIEELRLIVEKLIARAGRAEASFQNAMREKGDLAHALAAQARAGREAAAIQTVRIRDLEGRLAETRGENDRHIAARENAQMQIRALSDHLVDAEAALAKSMTGQNGSIWTRLISSSKKSHRAERQLMNSGLFDAPWYLREYPDVAKSDSSPVEHYLAEGYLRGCRPNPMFDTRWYLGRYEDVRRAGVNPLLHYLTDGYREGRDPSPDFQTDFYLEANPDVRGSGMNPLEHYLRYGRYEGRYPVRPA
jgi:hypothetical protein